MKKTKRTLIDKNKILREMVSTNKFGTFFGVTQKTLDKVWDNLTSTAGNSATYISMEIGADRDVFHPVRDRLNALKIKGSTNEQLDYFSKMFLAGPTKIPNYSGGLGILAGDTLKSFADCKIPVLAVSLFYRKGYFSQLVDSRVGQIVWFNGWEPEKNPAIYLLSDPDKPEKPLTIEVPFFDKRDKKVPAYAQLWLKMEINDNLDYFVPEVLLDFDLPSSPEWIRNSSQNLYDSSSERTKAIQRRLLGAGVVPAMRALGITSKTIHLNEQHGVIVVLHLISEKLREIHGPDYPVRATDDDIFRAAEAVAERVVYTIHTPVKAGHDRFLKDIYKDLGHSFCRRILDLLATDEEQRNFYNFTALAMRVNRATNSVSRLHKDVTKRQFMQYADKISAITNGVHHLTWVSDARAELYDNFSEFDNWRQDPGVFKNAPKLLKNNKFRTYLERAWSTDTGILISYVNDMLTRHRKQMHETWIDPPNFLSFLDAKESELDPSAYTIGFARRFSTYKRADLIFEDIDTLIKPIVKNNWPVNFIYAGKAHPADEPGKYLIKLVLDCQEELYQKSGGLAKLVFIPDYDMAIAKMMVSGVHAWLNSPKRPLEASGTSGMKAAMNGVPNISIMDGWWSEGYHDGKAGWKFGYETPVEEASLSESPSFLLYAEDSASFYRIFPKILEAFYDRESRSEYIDKSIMNLALNCPKFNTHRMAAEYVARYDLSLPSPVAKNINKFRKLYRSDEF